MSFSAEEVKARLVGDTHDQRLMFFFITFLSLTRDIVHCMSPVRCASSIVLARGICGAVSFAGRTAFRTVDA